MEILMYKFEAATGFSFNCPIGLHTRHIYPTISNMYQCINKRLSCVQLIIIMYSFHVSRQHPLPQRPGEPGQGPPWCWGGQSGLLEPPCQPSWWPLRHYKNKRCLLQKVLLARHVQGPGGLGKCCDCMQKNIHAIPNGPFVPNRDVCNISFV